MFGFCRDCFPKRIPTSNVMKVLRVVLWPHQHLVLSLKNFAVLISVQWHLIVTLIRTSLMANAEQFLKVEI